MPQLTIISQYRNTRLIGFEIAAVSEEFKEIMKEKMEDRMKGGIRSGGGMSGGGMPGGMLGGGSRDNMMKDMDAQEIWVSIELA